MSSKSLTGNDSFKPKPDSVELQKSEAASRPNLDVLLSPKTIAVIGASHKPDTIGNKLFRNLLYQDFQGVVYPVNPTVESVAATRAYPTILDVPGPVDLAIIIVPADLVYEVAEQCGQKGVKAIVVISAGFGESRPAGIEKQKKLLEIIRKYRMCMVGPNCMGIINTGPVSMNATFSEVYPPSGNVAMGTQSGALGLAILEYAKNLNIGLSTFVSLGNSVDVSSNNLLRYWEKDPATHVVLLYLESFGSPRQFARIARAFTRTKPIIAVKSGRTPAGSRAAASHTGALVTSEVALEALFKQVGIIRVDTLEELFDAATLIAHQPLPVGKRVVILTNGGGPGILTADACSAKGLEVPILSKNTADSLRSVLRSDASVANPIDMTAQATTEQYRQALKILAKDKDIDILIVIFIPPVLTRPEEVAAVIREIAPEFRKRGKTMLASFMGTRGAAQELGSKEQGYVPSFTFPESAASAVYGASEYSEYLKKPKGSIPSFEDINKEKAVELINTTLAKSLKRPLWLNSLDVFKLLSFYGIKVAPVELASDAGEAAQKAKNLGFPVAVKLFSDTITHKTDVGGVVLNVDSEKAVAQAFGNIQKRLKEAGKDSEMQGVLVQKMIKAGVETIVGVTQDKSFGPLIIFGLGGIYTELFNDVNTRIHPLTDIEANEMIHSVKAYRLLEGWRGSPRRT